MKKVFLTEGEYIYNCPHCGIEIADYSKDEMENEEVYCGKCMNEFRIEIIENNN